MARSEKLQLVSADNHSYSLHEVKQVGNGTTVQDPGNKLNNKGYEGDDDPSTVFIRKLHGGTGHHLRVSYRLFWSAHYEHNPEEMPEGEDPETWERPLTELEEERKKWEDLYNMDLSGREGFAIDVNISDFGFGYKGGDIVNTKESSGKDNREMTIKLSTKNMGWQLTSVSGATKSYWENNYINPKGAPYVLRELMGTRQTIIDVSGHKMMGVHGWEYMFNNFHPIGPYKKYGTNATDTPGLQIMVDKAIAASAGVVFGNILAHQDTQRQRWVIPKGISYCWDNRHSANNSKGLILQSIRLLFKLEGEKVTRYVSLVEDSHFIGNGEALYHSHLVNQDSNDKAGVIRCFMIDEEFQYLHEHKGRCIGTYMRYGNHKQGTQYDNVVNFYNYRFLYGEESYSKSKMILPSPVTMLDSQTKGLKL